MSFFQKITKAVCIGRNYADHVKELGNELPKQPFFFIKPRSAVLAPGQGPILRPKGVQLHYELELGVVIGKEAKNINPANFTMAQADQYIAGYTVGLDLTARNVQASAKKAGLPWSAAKGFDTFLPLSDFIPKAKIPNPDDAWLQLKVNNEIRQNDSTNLMIHKIPQLIAFISNIMTLEEGDVVMTGTPKGVGEIVPGDVLRGVVMSNKEVVGELNTSVADKPGYYEFRED